MWSREPALLDFIRLYKISVCIVYIYTMLIKRRFKHCKLGRDVVFQTFKIILFRRSRRFFRQVHSRYPHYVPRSNENCVCLVRLTFYFLNPSDIIRWEKTIKNK